MRVLFFNEGNLGSHIMGQGQLDSALHDGLTDLPDLQTRFAGLSPMSRLENALATRPLPALARLDLDFTTLRWHGVQSVRARMALQRELRAWPADVVHVHSHSVSLAMGAEVHGARLALSLDTTVRDWAQMPAWRLERSYGPRLLTASAALERRALERAAIVFAWTGWARRAVEREAPRAHVVEHHPGIDLEHYRPAVRRERELPRVLFVGGRFEEKGGLDLLAALGDQLGRTVELDLVTPAAVPRRAGVTVHRLGPSDPQLLDLQQQADVYCLPTGGDGAPWAILEAMACGTPVVSTPIGGIPDMLEDGRAGILTSYADPTALGRVLRELLANAELRRELAARGRARAESHYDASGQTASLVEQLRQIC
jgi:glycosyltransferase involved in cell wall biosynthesis